jgi:hypothetical protein
VKKIVRVPLSPSQPTNGEARPQKGIDEVFQPRISTEALRALNHMEWLRDFAKMMQLKTGVEMTPMRAGVISRLNLAAEYIALLRHDAQTLATGLRASEHDLDLAMKEIARQKEELTRHDGGEDR